ncbi:MAG TPA: NAD(P)H-binding protein [Bacteroidia bacterium]|jgi:putative NADH-flavin reductase|nr:NAD(P)H-binding protein [Bacteroidia bacterium]
MKQNKKIAIIGGTGKSGKYLVKELINQSFQIKLLLRDPKKLKVENPLIEVIEGSVRDYDTVKTLLTGCAAVISTLGQPKGEPTVFSQATRNIIKAMAETGIKRYIVTTGLNIDTPFDEKSPKTKFATEWMKTNYPETTNDKQVEYSILFESNADWTLVRLPLIELTDNRQKIAVSLKDCPGDKISATDLAHFLLEQLTDTDYLCKAPFIANE